MKGRWLRRGRRRGGGVEEGKREGEEVLADVTDASDVSESEIKLKRVRG